MRRRAMESGQIWADPIVSSSPGTSSGWRKADYPRLWLGAGRDAANLAKLGEHQITHVLNCADDVPNYHEGASVVVGGCGEPIERRISHLRLEVSDFGTDAGISRVFPKAAAFIKGAWECGGNVLVHCANGTNRSATVTVAICMILWDMSLIDSWSMVCSCRPSMAPLADNRAELIKYELKIRGSTTAREGNGGRLCPVNDQNGCNQGSQTQVLSDSQQEYSPIKLNLQE